MMGFIEDLKKPADTFALHMVESTLQHCTDLNYRLVNQNTVGAYVNIECTPEWIDRMILCASIMVVLSIPSKSRRAHYTGPCSLVM